MSIKVYINRKLFDKPDAKVSVYDHGLLYGDGVFEGMRVYGGKVFQLSEHIDRLYESAAHICLEVPIAKDEMIDAVQFTVAANEKSDGYVRLILTRGAGALGLDPRKCTDPQLIIMVDDIRIYPPELYENGMEIVTAATIRNHPGTLDPRVKSLNYLNGILAKIEATSAGCMEALMLNDKGEIAECTRNNVFLVTDGTLKTPSADAGILVGITRNVVMELAKRAEIPVAEAILTRHDVYTADECFLTGTATEVIPVVKCDGRRIGSGQPGPITAQLRKLFRVLVREG